MRQLSAKALQERVLEMGLPLKSKNTDEILRALLQANAEKQGFKLADGVFDVGRGGAGFLRLPQANYQPQSEDVFVSPHLARRFRLQPGDLVTGISRSPSGRRRYHTLLHVDLIWNESPEKLQSRKAYDELTPFYPQKRLVLENGADSISMRALDLLAPLGRGQRCLLVAPPRAGKTILLQQIAGSIGVNDPDVDIIVLLLDERPEEVHSMRRIVQRGEVISSTFDETPERHVHVADLVIEKAHRMLENGRHVALLLDSLTRMSRACNALTSSRGKLMSGGIEASALVNPRKFFSSARNIENGGSLTIIGTVLVETGSRMDDLIFEEFKGTGNMEVYLSRDLQERRIYPAIHIEKSGTRREDLLYHPDEMIRIQALRRQLSEHPPLEAMEKLIEQLEATSSNAELLMRLKLE
ncbi:MAG: transcription termination factor Rho [Verrucomicrobia bacterium]|nr:transcription termination factor Rho [Verrucomicrobiota bacterium]